MKKFFVVLLIICSFNVYAQIIPVIDAAVQSVLEITYIDQIISFAQQLQQMVQSVNYLYQQTVNMVLAEERAIENLWSIADVKSFDDLMKWHNRQLYMDKEVEDRFLNMGVKIGGKTYRVEDIDNIPNALRHSFGDLFWNDFTPEQRREMYLELGLSPSNYNYVKKWQQREDEFARRIQVQSSIWKDENEEAAGKYRDLANKYFQPTDSMDINEILKNMHLTQMQTEMVLREIARQNAEKYEYDVAQNKLSATPPSPPRLSDTWNANFFEPITEHDWTIEYSWTIEKPK